jgi:hypothetical protein
MCNCCENYNNQGELIEEDNGGSTPSPDNTEVIVFNPNVDYLADGSSAQAPLFEDDFIIIGFDAGGGDVEMRIKSASSQYECYASRNHSTSQNTLLSVVGNTYDIFSTGITSDDTLQIRMSSPNNKLARHYEISFQLTGLTTNNAWLHIDYHLPTSDRYV